MAVRIGAGVSLDHDPRAAGEEAARRAAAGLDGHDAGLAVVFLAGAHLTAPEAALEAIAETLDPGVLVGCGAGGVLALGREHESGTAAVVWAAHLDGGEALAQHVAPGEVADLGPPGEATALLLLADPYTCPAEALLADLHARAPGMPVVGGLASARGPGGACLFLDGEVRDGGALAVALSGVEVLPCVSQGAAPLGPELTVTAAQGNLILELAGRPAVRTLHTAIAALEPAERELLSQGMLLGLVVDQGKPEFGRGDFLVRPVLGIDENTGAIAVGGPVRPGQVVRIHARDAASASADLRGSLALVRAAFGGAPPAGALAFTCNGRGTAMFGEPGHDAALLAHELDAPAAGMFAAGEFGPVGGESFLHGFTATVAVFGR